MYNAGHKGEKRCVWWKKQGTFEGDRNRRLSTNMKEEGKREAERVWKAQFPTDFKELNR